MLHFQWSPPTSPSREPGDPSDQNAGEIVLVDGMAEWPSRTSSIAFVTPVLAARAASRVVCSNVGLSIHPATSGNSSFPFTLMSSNRKALQGTN
jgi:hypothetical protein